MKAFLVGLITIVAVVVLSMLGVLLFPFILVLGLLARIALAGILLLFAIWLLGKFALYLWEKMK